MRYTSKLLFALTSLALAGACTPVDQPRDGEHDSYTDGTALSVGEKQAILAYVNAPATDFVALDDDAGLNALAAARIIDHRDGADALAGTGDDDPFDDMGELDSVPYVGPAAITTLRLYVGEPPASNGETVEGVEFTAAEASAIVWGVNRATMTELDQELNLDRRAALNLVRNGQYTSVAEMGDVAYVGQTALRLLRGFAPVWQAVRENGDLNEVLAGTYDDVVFDQPTAAAALDIANFASVDELTADGGMWSVGAQRIVDNAPYSDLSEVAGVSGDGTATMSALHDFAASGTWDGGDVD